MTTSIGAPADSILLLPSDRDQLSTHCPARSRSEVIQDPRSLLGPNPGISGASSAPTISGTIGTARVLPSNYFGHNFVIGGQRNMKLPTPTTTDSRHIVEGNNKNQTSTAKRSIQPTVKPIVVIEDDDSRLFVSDDEGEDTVQADVQRGTTSFANRLMVEETLDVDMEINAEDTVPNGAVTTDELSKASTEASILAVRTNDIEMKNDGQGSEPNDEVETEESSDDSDESSDDDDEANQYQKSDAPPSKSSESGTESDNSDSDSDRGERNQKSRKSPEKPGEASGSEESDSSSDDENVTETRIPRIVTKSKVFKPQMTKANYRILSGTDIDTISLNTI